MYPFSFPPVPPPSFAQRVWMGQALAPEGASDGSWTIDSLRYSPGFGEQEAKVLQEHMPVCVLPQLTPSDHLMLLGIAAITHTLFGGSVASSLDAPGELSDLFRSPPSPCCAMGGNMVPLPLLCEVRKCL